MTLQTLSRHPPEINLPQTGENAVKLLPLMISLGRVWCPPFLAAKELHISQGLKTCTPLLRGVVQIFFFTKSEQTNKLSTFFFPIHPMKALCPLSLRPWLLSGIYEAKEGLSQKCLVATKLQVFQERSSYGISADFRS